MPSQRISSRSDDERENAQAVALFADGLDPLFFDPGLRIENRAGPGGLTSTPNGNAVSGSDTTLRTNVAIGPIIPEPSCSLLALAGCVAFFARRRK